MTSLKELIRLVPQDRVDEFLRELDHVGGTPNTVRVVKYERTRPDPHHRAIMKKALDEVFPTRLGVAAITKLDELRMLAGLQPHYLREFLRLGGGELVDVTANLRTTIGIDYVADSLGSRTVAGTAVAKYMALSENATAPATGDTTLTAEITTAGLQRVAASYAHTTGAASYSLSNTFTATGTFSAVQKEGLFTASSAGNLFVENTFTATALVSGDQLTVAHTINV